MARRQVRFERRDDAPRRRGVVLLLIISLMALFTLVAITYVISASHHKATALTLAKLDRFDDDPKDFLDRVMHDIVVGTQNRRSPLWAHDLLSDMYGYRGGGGGKVTVVADKLGGQFVQLDISVEPGDPIQATDLATLGYCTGRVLTMLSGDAAGISTRIVKQSLAADGTPGPSLLVLPFEGDGVVKVTPKPGDRYWINGPAFAGTGFAYNPATGKRDLTADGGEPLVAFPNFAHNQSADPTLGGVNESWDAPDLENMALALITDHRRQGLPSFHRPAAIAMHAQHQDELRKVMLRPNPADHPLFTGSNRAFDPVNGPWDVDNNGDGVPDSVWIDPGHPIMTAPDGRRYKRLVAPLVMPLDGRMNINAAGTHTRASNQTDVAGPWAGAFQTSIRLPSGLGFGPADIYLNDFLGPDYAAVMKGGNDPTTGRPLLGRYGDAVGRGLPGKPQVRDDLSKIKHFDYARDWFGFFRNLASHVPEGWQYPPDLDSTIKMALDVRGNPFWVLPQDVIGGNTQDVLLDNPYEKDLSRNAARGQSTGATPDALFSAAEYERFLRQYDADARSLPDRLWNLAPTLRQKWYQFTFDSFDLPVPNVGLPADLRAIFPNGTRPRHIVELLRARLQSEGGAAQAARLIPAYMAPEMLAGTRFDLNRPFGNGRNDGAADQTVDDTDEARAAGGLSEKVWVPQSGVGGGAGTVPTGFSAIAFQHTNNDSYLSTDPGRAREVYARHLYVMMMLMLPRNIQIDFNNDGRIAANETAQGVAQWAINVVEFRDRDATMTKFFYDPTPFDSNSWTPSAFVWGCERPELIMTEAMAGHQKNTSDEAEGGRTDAMPRDDDFDSIRKPDSWLYVELYNPSSPYEPPPAEFYYDNKARQWKNGVVLDQVSPDDLPGEARGPVWRLLIINTEQDPDDPVSPENYDGEIVRSVYFVPRRIVVPLDGSRNSWDYYRDPGTQLAPLPPGHYAVIGPARRKFIAFKTDGLMDQTTTRQVQLNPSGTLNTNQVQVVNNNGDEPNQADIKPAVAIICNRPGPLSITSPPGNDYPNTVPDPMGGNITFNAAADGGLGRYSKPIDTPLDRSRVQRDPVDNFPELHNRQGTLMNYRVIHLQRLANPLKQHELTTNPYVTVDSMPLDLQIYNGITNKTDPIVTTRSSFMFATRERGETAFAREPGSATLWNQTYPYRNPPRPASIVTPPDQTDYHFPYKLQHTLGYLNRTFGPGLTAGEAPSAEYRGDPKWRGFGWLSWNNRPFISHLELLMVPYSRSANLLRDYRTPQEVGAPVNPYTASRQSFAHLLNFFRTRSEAGGAAVPEFNRLLEYLHVPSRFVGTELWGAPGAFTADAAALGMRPPFNKVSMFRDPGKININMIYDYDVWRAVANDYPEMNTPEFWDKLVRSRKGYSDGGSDVLARSPMFPTEFANPFRSVDSVGLIGAEGGDAATRPVDGSLLRPDPDNPAKPLFSYTAESGIREYDNPKRNAYFHLQGLQRLGNLVTTRSNVYAIWLTVGYFEVLPISEQQRGNPNAATLYPEGVQLGPELGSDRGDIKRHRAFYMLDRTIPVAAQPGRVNNVHRALLINRLIE